MQYPDFGYDDPACVDMPGDEFAQLRDREIFQASTLFQATDLRPDLLPGRGDADLSIWSRMSFWTADEISALAIGKNPTVVSPEACNKRKSEYHICRQYLAIREIVERAIIDNQLPSPCRPGFALAWLDRHQIHYPTVLRSSIELFGSEIGDWKTMYERYSEHSNLLERQLDELQQSYASESNENQRTTEELHRWLNESDEMIEQHRSFAEKQSERIVDLEAEVEQLQNRVDDSASTDHLDPRERATFEKLLITMAMDAYGYQLGDKVSPIPAELEGILLRNGMAVSAETIRNKLKSAACQRISIPKHE